jgi:hypothetical protein
MALRYHPAVTESRTMAIRALQFVLCNPKGVPLSIHSDFDNARSIAKEVGVQPRIVSLWRHRYAVHGLEGLQDKQRPGKQPIYTKATDKRILRLLDKPPPAGFARWTGPPAGRGAGRC